MKQLRYSVIKLCYFFLAIVYFVDFINEFKVNL